jgi:putative ABC transport system substrate-binding protein
MHVRLVSLLGFILTTLLNPICLAVDNDRMPVIEVAQNTETFANQKRDKPDALVILGLVDSLHQDVRNAITMQLGELNIVYADVSEIQKSTYRWPDVDKVIATGVAGCKQAVDVQLNVPVVCVFLTSESFQGIVEQRSVTDHANLTAIVIDQPLSRQATLAKKVYPALSRFAVLSKNKVSQSVIENDDIYVSAYRTGKALAPQLIEGTTSLDALIATPETAIYNRSTLRTVLLTAYGYGKPVVGYSRAYVKAGALITGYSTPDQVFRQIAEMSDDSFVVKSVIPQADRVATSARAVRVISPKYFSIVDNPSVAKSLGLIKLFEFSAGKSYQDKDFQS